MVNSNGFHSNAASSRSAGAVGHRDPRGVAARVGSGRGSRVWQPVSKVTRGEAVLLIHAPPVWKGAIGSACAQRTK